VNVLKNLDRIQDKIDTALGEFQDEVEKLVKLSNAMAESCNLLKTRQARPNGFAGRGQTRKTEAMDDEKIPEGIKPRLVPDEGKAAS
jgi:hypothetical protein